MKKEFDFSNTGKRMPYRMPEGYLADMEKTVMERVHHAPAYGRHTAVHPLFRNIVAAAAAVTLLAVCHATMQPRHMEGYNDVERAFDKLSYDDQQFMLDTYDSDVFAEESGYTNM